VAGQVLLPDNNKIIHQALSGIKSYSNLQSGFSVYRG
jgi:hypothetical protein